MNIFKKKYSKVHKSIYINDQIRRKYNRYSTMYYFMDIALTEVLNDFLLSPIALLFPY